MAVDKVPLAQICVRFLFTEHVPWIYTCAHAQSETLKTLEFLGPLKFVNSNVGKALLVGC